LNQAGDVVLGVLSMVAKNGVEPLSILEEAQQLIIVCSS
jgi:hypothetical protein